MEYVGKGETLKDGTYLYTCSHCWGKGERNGAVCDWCYDLNPAKILAAMKEGARGQRYYGLLKAFLSINGKGMVDCANSFEKMTPVELGYIHLKFGLNFKATVEWLEETRCVRIGTYERFEESRFKVRDVVAAALKKYPELTG